MTKVIQIKAENSQGIKIIERIMEDGTRYLKFTPNDPRFLGAIKNQFKDKPVKITASVTGWIEIKKEKTMDDIQKVLSNKIKPEDINIDFIVKAEVELLSQNGYITNVETLEINK